MKIIGVTVGTTTPKPNYEQTNPRKGDYIKGNILSAINPDVTLTQDGQVADAKAVGDKFAELVGDTPVANQITAAVEQKAQVQFVTWESDD